MHAPNPFAAPAAETQDPAAATAAKQPPWSPGAIAAMAFFFSFLPGGIMYALNWERLGMPERKRPALIAVIAGFVVFVLAAGFVPDGNPLEKALNFINIAVTIFLYNGQKVYFAKHFAAHHTKASVKWPLLYSLAVIFVVVGLFVVYFMMTDEPQ